MRDSCKKGENVTEEYNAIIERINTAHKQLEDDENFTLEKDCNVRSALKRYGFVAKSRLEKLAEWQSYDQDNGTDIEGLGTY